MTDIIDLANNCEYDALEAQGFYGTDASLEISMSDSGEVWDGSPKIVDCGTDERIGSYPYEIEIGVRKGEYNHEGNFVAYRRYLGGLNRLSDNQFHNFDFHEDAIVFAQRWIN